MAEIRAGVQLMISQELKVCCCCSCYIFLLFVVFSSGLSFLFCLLLDLSSRELYPGLCRLIYCISTQYRFQACADCAVAQGPAILREIRGPEKASEENILHTIKKFFILQCSRGPHWAPSQFSENIIFNCQIPHKRSISQFSDKVILPFWVQNQVLLWAR